MSEQTKLAALKEGDWFAFSGCSSPKCPHCGEHYNIARNDAWELYDDNESHEVSCPSCALDFKVVTYTKHTFSTEDQEDER